MPRNNHLGKLLHRLLALIVRRSDIQLVRHLGIMPHNLAGKSMIRPLPHAEPWWLSPAVNETYSDKRNASSAP